MRRTLLTYENMQRRWMHGEQFKKVLKYLLNSLLKIWIKSIMKEFWRKIIWIEKHGDNDWQLQFDNDPKHKSKLAIDFLKNKKVDFIDWPPYSPGLNPTENV